MKFSCRCLKGSVGGGLRPLTGQTLLVDCFHKLINVSSPMSIHNLRHLSCTMVGEGMQKPKTEVCQGDAKNQAAILIFP